MIAKIGNQRKYAPFINGLENRAAKKQPCFYLVKCSMSMVIASRSRSDNFEKRIASKL